MVGGRGVGGWMGGGGRVGAGQVARIKRPTGQISRKPPKLADVSKAACVPWALNHDPTEKGPGKIIEVGEDGIRQLAAVPLPF